MALSVLFILTHFLSDISDSRKHSMSFFWIHFGVTFFFILTHFAYWLFFTIWVFSENLMKRGKILDKTWIVDVAFLRSLSNGVGWWSLGTASFSSWGMGFLYVPCFQSAKKSRSETNILLGKLHLQLGNLFGIMMDFECKTTLCSFSWWVYFWCNTNWTMLFAICHSSNRDNDPRIWRCWTSKSNLCNLCLLSPALLALPQLLNLFSLADLMSELIMLCLVHFCCLNLKLLSPCILFAKIDSAQPCLLPEKTRKKKEEK